MASLSGPTATPRKPACLRAPPGPAIPREAVLYRQAREGRGDWPVASLGRCYILGGLGGDDVGGAAVGLPAQHQLAPQGKAEQPGGDAAASCLCGPGDLAKG